MPWHLWMTPLTALSFGDFTKRSHIVALVLEATPTCLYPHFNTIRQVANPAIVCRPLLASCFDMFLNSTRVGQQSSKHVIKHGFKQANRKTAIHVLGSLAHSGLQNSSMAAVASRCDVMEFPVAQYGSNQIFLAKIFTPTRRILVTAIAGGAPASANANDDIHSNLLFV